MSTIEELEQQAADIARGELEVMAGLRDSIREAAVGMPDGSKLARHLAVTARDMETYSMSAEVQALKLMGAVKDLLRGQRREQRESEAD